MRCLAGGLPVAEKKTACKVNTEVYKYTQITNCFADEEYAEPPETPAPVFAVRALKSAVWGTPAPPEDETVYELEEKRKEENKTRKQVKLADIGGISPTKPTGILLTPGIGATRRKNVVFGTEVVDNEGKSAARKAVSREGVGMSPSLEHSSRTRSKTSLTRTLENSRQRKTRNLPSESVSGSRSQESTSLFNPGKDSQKEKVPMESQRNPAISKRSNQELVQQLDTGVDNDGDMTMDLNEPHSQSGKYWKSEFETYQGEMREQMEKLLRYKQLAKSYAKKKDAEASELSAKLKEEERRVNKMEERMSELSARVAIDGSNDDSPEFIKELARQTALAVQYRAQVQEFKAAMEENVDLANHITRKHASSPENDQALLETRQELRKAKTQLKEATSLEDEVKRLRQALAAAEKLTLKLQEENTKLTRDLLHADLRLGKRQEKSEKQRLSSEEHLRKKDEALRNLQIDYDTLKEQMNTQRRDSEHLLKKRHDQVVTLRKELAAANSADSRKKELQIALEKKVTEHGKSVTEYSTKVAESKEDGSDGRISRDARSHPGHSQSAHPQDKSLVTGSIVKSRSSQDLFFESQIPNLSESIGRPSTSMARLRAARSDTPAGSPALKFQQSHPALSEINNSSSTREHPAFQRADLLRATPLYNRTHNAMLEDPSMDLPSLEPSLVGLTDRPRYERKPQDSPRPSMFNIASSPPKPAMVRSRSSDKLSTRRSIGDLDMRRHADMSSSRAERSGSKGKSTLPPERAAAAKARLQQKNAEKKKAHALGIGKENVR